MVSIHPYCRGLKAAIHYITFDQIVGPICSLDALDVGSQSQSAIFGLSKLKDFAEN